MWRSLARLPAASADGEIVRLLARALVSEHACQTLVPVVESESSAPELRMSPLGIRLAVGQQTLDLFTQVRILDPQPLRKLPELLFEKKLLIPALRQLVSSHPKQHDG
jgi:hypothetical protein